MEQFTPFSIPENLPPEKALRLHRLNSLGSLYYFTKIALRRKRLTEHFHLPLCREVERPFLKDVFEIPRDHFKSTIASESLPMWRALPFTNQDEDELKVAGYSDEFIRWMRFIHNPNIRHLLVSENITNSAMLGKRIRRHFESNAFYRALFYETIPDSTCVWGNFSLQVRGAKGPHGEGTFDFLGAGGALQSRHYNGLIVQDDLVGRKALESPSIMDWTIEGHKLLPGAFEDEDATHEGSELVIGNRWGFHDLNSYIRENEPWFRFHTHSAFGGCCSQHEQDKPLCPELFSFEKLMRLKQRLGTYFFSCQFLNNPAAPEDADFREEWLGYYRLITDKMGNKIIQHEVKNGFVRPDMPIKRLRVGMCVDPTHSGNSGSGRCRHAIVVSGMSDDDNWYIIDPWAQACGFDTFFNKIYEMAEKWQQHRVGFETCAGQGLGAFHIEQGNRTRAWQIRIIELKGEVEGPDGKMVKKKEWRIKDIIGPIAESSRLWVQRAHQDFIGEYTTFPRGRFCDQLDAAAYTPQVVKKSISYIQDQTLKAANLAQMQKLGHSYSVRVH